MTPSEPRAADGGTRKLRLGWMSTGRGPGSRRLLESTAGAIRRGELDASIDYVFCSRERGEAEGSDAFLDLVAELDIEPLTLSFRAYRNRSAHPASGWRTRYNTAVLDLVRGRPVDLLVLAGLLLVLDEPIVTAVPTLNLHPAAPDGPVGTWQEVIRRQILDRASGGGAMTLLATADVDRGPVVSFCRFALRGPALDPLWTGVDASPPPASPRDLDGTPLFDAIRSEGVRREVPLLIATLRAVAAGELRFESGRVLDRNGAPAAGLNLTAEIERSLPASL